jgi:hypothetical protein
LTRGLKIAEDLHFVPFQLGKDPDMRASPKTESLVATIARRHPGANTRTAASSRTTPVSTPSVDSTSVSSMSWRRFGEKAGLARSAA